MQTKRNIKEIGNVLLCVLGAILVVSAIGATVLRNATTRLNASSNQVRAWKESLSAAETGGDIGFAEIRKQISPDGLIRASQWVGWTPSGTGYGYVNPQTTFGSNNLMAETTVEKCYFKSATNTLTLWDPTDPTRPANPWYRLRSKGTAPLPNLKRTGMDDALTNDGSKHFAAIGSTQMQDITARGNGDSLLRKIDFKTDHFIATYGPKGDGVGKTLTPVATPQISRRIEQIVTPVTPFFDAAIKAAGTFYGLGSAAYIDSYDSRNGPYDPTVKTNPASPYYKDSRHGSVQIGSGTAQVMGTIYGDVATDGGTITHNTNDITGTIDNNVPFTLEDYFLPEPLDPLKGGRSPINLAPMAGNETLTPTAAGTNEIPMYYAISSIPKVLTVAPSTGNPPGSLPPQETYVAIHVTGDISGSTAGITVNPLVHLKIYFNGNISMKNNNIINQSPSTTNPYAGNLQFYGISPPRDPVTNIPMYPQTIDLNSGTPATLAATFYAPSADVTENGNPDFIGTMVCKSFYANGNISWHYDRALNDAGELQDFRIASYVEDTR